MERVCEPSGPMVDIGFELESTKAALDRHRVNVQQRRLRGCCPQCSYASPISVHWEFTNRCNLGCAFCYNAATSVEQSRLPEERLLEIADEMVEMHVLEVTFSGGEVLTEPKVFWSLAERLGRAGTFLRLITNGWYVTDDVADRLGRVGVHRVNVSLDASEPDAHDRLRGVKGSWRRAVLGLGSLARAGLVCTVTCVLTEAVAEFVEDIVSLCDLLGVKQLTFEDLRNTGRGWDNQEQLRLTDAQYEEVYLRLRRLHQSRRTGCRIVFGSDTRFVISLLQVSPLFTCCIRWTGDVVPLEAVRCSCGNIAGETFRSIWLRLQSAHRAGDFAQYLSMWTETQTPGLGLARSTAVLPECTSLVQEDHELPQESI